MQVTVSEQFHSVNSLSLNYNRRHIIFLIFAFMPDVVAIFALFLLHLSFVYHIFVLSFNVSQIYMAINKAMILRISPYSVRMREITDQKNSEYEHFRRSVLLQNRGLESSRNMHETLLFNSVLLLQMK